MIRKTYTCIVCPKSCKGTLTIFDDGTMQTEGFDCKNGEQYAENEYTDAKRMLTTTVRLENGLYPLLPVVSSLEISKSVLKDCLDMLYNVKVTAPVREGDVIVKNILDTGVDILAARSL